MLSFRKRKECPSSEELLRCRDDQIGGLNGLTLARHLTECDFCLAELELYESFPPGPIEEITSPTIPDALRELADALLTRSAHADGLEDLLRAASERRSGRDRRSLSRASNA